MLKTGGGVEKNRRGDEIGSGVGNGCWLVKTGVSCRKRVVWC